MPIKIAGQEIDPTLPEDLIVLRPDTDSEIIVRARAFRDFDEFHAVCPIPEAPGRQVRGKGWVLDTNDDTFKQRMEQYSLKRVGWMVLQTLYEIEWEVVDSDDPKTWPKWEDEMKDSGFTQVECNLIMALVIDVTSLNEDKMTAAKESFLHGQEAAQKDSNSPTSERQDLSNGEVASD